MFFSSQAAEDEQRKEQTDKAKNLLYDFYGNIKDKFNDTIQLSLQDDNAAILYVEDDEHSIAVDFLNNNISLRNNIRSISVRDLAKENDPFFETYKTLENELQTYVISKNIKIFSRYLYQNFK